MHRLLLLYSWLVRLMLGWLPDAPAIMRLRGAAYSIGMESAGKDFQVSSSVVIKNLEMLSVGDHVYFAPGVIINAIGRVRLDDEVMVGFNSVVVSGNHANERGSFRVAQSIPKEVYIARGAWIGANSSVLAGAKIGSGCILGANSCTAKCLVAGGVYGGVPARRIK